MLPLIAFFPFFVHQAAVGVPRLLLPVLLVANSSRYAATVLYCTATTCGAVLLPWQTAHAAWRHPVTVA